MHSELQSDEVHLAGGWDENGGETAMDAVAARIDWLVRERLERVTTDTNGRDTLYRDPRDGRLWEHIVPHSDRHGGGPASLRHISPTEAMTKYEIHLEIVQRKIRKILPDMNPKEVLARLKALGPNRHRVWLAVLKLHEEGDGDLSSLIQTAQEDYRDVLAWAESPNQMRFGPADDPERAGQLREMDRLQYDAWLNR